MANFEIVIDNVAVFSGERADVRPEVVLPISFTIDGKTLKTVDEDALRSAHQNGRSVRTQITPKDSTLALEKLLESGKDVLLMSVSSGISESFATASYIAHGLSIKYPDRKITVVDTLSCGAGEGLLFALATKWRENGLNMAEVEARLHEAKLKLHHVFVTDDSNLLSSSGIIPKNEVVNVKPIFDISSGGRVSVLQKTMGKKKALTGIVKYVANTLDKDFCKDVVITYGNEEEAKVICDNLKGKLEGANVVMVKENLFVATYLGESSVSVCFFGEDRK
ncbi:MAG: DegV family EDD domain-containing protein [Clostridia bacterium]|nr:DegV family EDD domain-containing protein [Clostridia bacterium]